MVLFDERTGVEVIERRECLQLLGAHQVGRLAILDGGSPLILPINYAMADEVIVFRTGEGTKLDASRGGPACFEIDETSATDHGGWSVVVRGTLHEVTAHDQPELDRVGDLADPWISDRPRVIELHPWSVTGRRLQPDPDQTSS